MHHRGCLVASAHYQNDRRVDGGVESDWAEQVTASATAVGAVGLLGDDRSGNPRRAPDA
jgi:hypothetical protein